jgi:membrane protease YdiL (CAAX protease family)
VIANFVCVALFDRFRLHLGLLVRPGELAGGFARGALVAVGLLSAANLLILSTTGFRHAAGSGADWGYVLALFVPAAIHEELVFRGYLFQKPARLNLTAAILVTSFLFAFVHGGNPSVGWIALVNIFLAGLLLALSWVWRRNLWIPIGMHVVWNLFSGPVLGHEVSGMVLSSSVLRTIDPGPALLTGGAFGIEASIYLTFAEIGAIAFVIWRIRAAGHAESPAAAAASPETAPASFAEGSGQASASVTGVDNDRVKETEI